MRPKCGLSERGSRSRIPESWLDLNLEAPFNGARLQHLCPFLRFKFENKEHGEIENRRRPLAQEGPVHCGRKSAQERDVKVGVCWKAPLWRRRLVGGQDFRSPHQGGVQQFLLLDCRAAARTSCFCSLTRYDSNGSRPVCATFQAVLLIAPRPHSKLLPATATDAAAVSLSFMRSGVEDGLDQITWT